jgi:hypothetical protein
LKSCDRRSWDWWPAYRQLVETIASIGERQTSGPHRSWVRWAERAMAMSRALMTSSLDGRYTCRETGSVPDY